MPETRPVIKHIIAINNVLYIPLPKKVADQVKLKQHCPIKIEVKDGAVVVTPYIIQ